MHKCSIFDVEKKTMGKIRISAVKYANTYPFIYGLRESGFEKKALIETDHPAECAKKLIEDKADLGLIPVGALPLLKEYHIVSRYCIGANGNVRTVMLLSNTPFEQIHSVYLDYRSRSSVNLVKVLAKNSWKRDFRWIGTEEGFDFTGISDGEAVVLIGDQCFMYEMDFKYTVDLAGAWKDYTGLPFVFACWVANKKLDDNFIAEFNKALEPGIKEIDAVVEMFGKSGIIKGGDLKKYLTENIDYDFNDDKKKALKLFLELMGKL
jgi:chorismate dehydratase